MVKYLKAHRGTHLFTRYYVQFKENKREGRDREQIEGTVAHNCKEA